MEELKSLLNDTPKESFKGEGGTLYFVISTAKNFKLGLFAELGFWQTHKSSKYGNLLQVNNYAALLLKFAVVSLVEGSSSSFHPYTPREGQMFTLENKKVRGMLLDKVKVGLSDGICSPHDLCEFLKSEEILNTIVSKISGTALNAGFETNLPVVKSVIENAMFDIGLANKTSFALKFPEFSGSENTITF